MTILHVSATQSEHKPPLTYDLEILMSKNIWWVFYFGSTGFIHVQESFVNGSLMSHSREESQGNI